MKTFSRTITVAAVILGFLLALNSSAAAANPYLPTGDTYTDITDPAANFGTQQYLLLSASTQAGCAEATYLWYKFDIPATSQTIGQADLHVTFDNFAAGTMDLELRSTADASWSETGLNWNNQPALDPTILAIVPNVTVNTSITFSGTTLADYLNSHQGQAVSLVIRPHCPNVVSPAADLVPHTKEHPSGSGVYLDLFTPNAVTVDRFTAAPLAGDNSLLFVGSLIVAALGGVLIFARRHRHA